MKVQVWLKFLGREWTHSVLRKNSALNIKTGEIESITKASTKFFRSSAVSREDMRILSEAFLHGARKLQGSEPNSSLGGSLIMMASVVLDVWDLQHSLLTQLEHLINSELKNFARNEVAGPLKELKKKADKLVNESTKTKKTPTPPIAQPLKAEQALTVQLSSTFQDLQILNLKVTSHWTQNVLNLTEGFRRFFETGVENFGKRSSELKQVRKNLDNIEKETKQLTRAKVFGIVSGAGAIFGRPLKALIAEQNQRKPSASVSQNPDVPAIVTACHNHLLRTDGYSKEGIFRVSGSKAVIDELKRRIDQGDDLDEVFANVHNSHDIAGVLRLFLRELPEPPFTYKLFGKLLKLDLEAKDETIKELLTIMSQLPEENYSLLRFLFQMCNHVLAHETENKMNEKNMSVVFSSNLIKAEFPNVDSMIDDLNRSNLVAEFCMKHSCEIFMLEPCSASATVLPTASTHVTLPKPIWAQHKPAKPANQGVRVGKERAQLDSTMTLTNSNTIQTPPTTPLSSSPRAIPTSIPISSPPPSSSPVSAPHASLTSYDASPFTGSPTNPSPMHSPLLRQQDLWPSNSLVSGQESLTNSGAGALPVVAASVRPPKPVKYQQNTTLRNLNLRESNNTDTDKGTLRTVKPSEGDFPRPYLIFQLAQSIENWSYHLTNGCGYETLTVQLKLVLTHLKEMNEYCKNPNFSETRELIVNDYQTHMKRVIDLTKNYSYPTQQKTQELKTATNGLVLYTEKLYGLFLTQYSQTGKRLLKFQVQGFASQITQLLKSLLGIGEEFSELEILQPLETMNSVINEYGWCWRERNEIGQGIKSIESMVMQLLKYALGVMDMQIEVAKKTGLQIVSQLKKLSALINTASSTIDEVARHDDAQGFKEMEALLQQFLVRFSSCDQQGSELATKVQNLAKDFQRLISEADIFTGRKVIALHRAIISSVLSIDEMTSQEEASAPLLCALAKYHMYNSYEILKISPASFPLADIILALRNSLSYMLTSHLTSFVENNTSQQPTTSPRSPNNNNFF